MGVRRATYGDEPILRSLRLQAMTDAPDAFGSTNERELARTTADWQRWIEPSPTFVFESSDGEPAGIVAAVRDPAEPSAITLVSMWLHPSARGTGAADALVEAVIAWAAAEHAQTLRVWVMKDNLPAARLYERNGFRPNGREARRDRDGGVEIEMHWHQGA